MGMQRLTPPDFELLENPGVKSVQIVWGKNAPEAKVTITRVTVQPGSSQMRHSHQGAEQIWLVERGAATLLLAKDQTAQMHEGDVIRTPAGDIHGVFNTSSEDFVYLAITTPPQDFSAAYGQSRQSYPAIGRPSHGDR
jgi:quercetin dioxygenase-like cupin family protein